MPYTRAYQLPSPLAAADFQLNAGETPTRLRPMLNITPSSNWIQETFYAKDIVIVEEKIDGGTKQVERLIIEKTKRPSLYQKFIDLQTRAKLFHTTISVSNLVPNTDTVKRFIEEADGDDVELDRIKNAWEMEIIKAATETDVNTAIDKITEETVYLRADLLVIAGLESIRLTISSPELPTRGDTPITAILYSPIDEAYLTTIGRGIPFMWTDRSGFVSTMTILPNVIYEIQPVSIDFRYALTLLA